MKVRVCKNDFFNKFKKKLIFFKLTKNKIYIYILKFKIIHKKKINTNFKLHRFKIYLAVEPSLLFHAL